MKISEVKTAFKIADVEFVAGSTKLNFNYLKDLRDENDKHPDWNVQEQGKDWPLEIKNEHAEIQKNAQSRVKKIARKEAKR